MKEIFHFTEFPLSLFNTSSFKQNSKIIKFKIQKLLIATTNCNGNNSIKNYPTVAIFILLIITNQSRYKTRQVQQK